MDKICDVKKDGLTYQCSDLIDTFETVDINGVPIRPGYELFTYAKAMCSHIIDSQKDRKSYFENSYKTFIYYSMLSKNILDALKEHKKGANFSKNYADFKICMKPLCSADGDKPDFFGCIKTYKAEENSKKCEKYLKRSNTPLAIKKKFFEEMRNLLVKTCMSQTNAELEADTGLCKTKVEFGTSLKKIVAKQDFYIGETVECTQEYFNKDLGWRLSDAKRARAVSGIVTGSITAAAGIVLTVLCAVGTVFSFGAAAPTLAGSIAMIVGGAATITSNALDMTVKDERITGHCYMSRKKIASEGQLFRIDWMF